MKTFIFIVALLSGFHNAMADTPQPMLVHAVVREIKHDPNSAPDDDNVLPGRQPAILEAILVIDKVLRGPGNLKGIEMHTLTAASPPQGNARVVTPKLNVGDEGIWAIKHVADGSLFEVYSPYEVEKGVYLPLIKGRHDAYEKVRSQLSGTAATSVLQDADKSPSAQPGEIPDAALTDKQPPALNTPNKETQTTSPSHEPTPITPGEEPASSTPWLILAVVVVAASGLLWLLLKGRK